MKLIHSDWSFQLELQEGIVQRMIIEDPVIFRKMIADLRYWQNGEDNKWILSDKGKILKADKSCEVIIDYFQLDLNQRKMISTLYDEMESVINVSELLIKWRSISAEIQEMLESAMDATDYDIICAEPDLKSLFKMTDVHFRDSSQGELEHLLEYQQLASSVKGIQLFILINATTFFGKQEMNYIYEQAKYKKYQLILLDMQNVEINREEENIMFIDKDCCIIDSNLR